MPTRPLGIAELRFMETAMADVAPDWSVDLEGICEGEASLVLLPAGGEDEMGPSFVISRESFGFTLDEVQWDIILEVGTYPSLADVVAAVDARLTTMSCFANLAPPTRH